MKTISAIACSAAAAALVISSVVTGDTKTAAYKGTAICKMCHKAIDKPVIDGYEKSAHAAAMQKADADKEKATATPAKMARQSQAPDEQRNSRGNHLQHHMAVGGEEPGGLRRAHGNQRHQDQRQPIGPLPPPELWAVAL